MSDLLSKYGVTDYGKQSDLLSKYGVANPQSYSGKVSDLPKVLPEAVARATDYGGGLMRTGMASSLLGQIVAAANNQKEQTVTGEDLKQALLGNAPKTAEYLKRVGYPNAGNAYFGNSPFGNPMTVGEVGDAASQVMGSMGLSHAMEQGGENLFKRGFKREDAILSSQDKMPISDIMWKRGQTPISQSGKLEAINNALGQATAERGAIEAPVIASGATGSMDAALAPAQQYASQKGSEKVASSQSMATRLQKLIDEQKALGEAPAIPAQYTSQQSPTGILDSYGNPIMKEEQIMTKSAQQAQPPPSYKDLQDLKRSASENVNWKSGVSDAEDKFYKNLGGGARQESYNVANSVDPGLGQKIAAKNEEVSSLLSMLPDAERKAIVEAGKHDVTQIDAILAFSHPELYVAKNIGRLIGQGGHTAGGRLINMAGKVEGLMAPVSPALNAISQQPKGNQ